MADVQHLSQATFERLTEEHLRLSTIERIDIARKIQSARELGDLSENGDYHAAKDSQGKMEARVRQLEALLKNSEIVEVDTSAGIVVAGSTVTLRYEGDDEDDTQDYFVGSIEERQGDLPVASPSAPLGAALLGQAVGDVVEYKAPGGSLKVEIVRIGS